MVGQTGIAVNLAFGSWARAETDLKKVKSCVQQWIRTGRLSRNLRNFSASWCSALRFDVGTVLAQLPRPRMTLDPQCLRLKSALAVKRAYLVDLCGLAEPAEQLFCRPAISNLIPDTPKKGPNWGNMTLAVAHSVRSRTVC